jgi:ornithine carbamoyltransferase
VSIAPATTPWPPALVEVLDLTSIAISELLDTAAGMRSAPPGQSPLAGEALAFYFEKPSTRARVSVDAAAHRLGMLPVTLRADELEAGDETPAAQAARVLAPYASALCVSAFDHRTVRDIAKASEVPVVNALTDDHDPCQAIADLLTLRDRFGRVGGLSVAYVGGGGSALHSLMEAAVRAEMDLRVACPPQHGPDPDVLEAARIFAEQHGARLTVTEDPEEAATGADAVYTAPWRGASRESPYRVIPRLMAMAKEDAVFLHPVGARHGEEVSPAVLNARWSVVREQAVNRLPAVQAAICSLVMARRAEAA